MCGFMTFYRLLSYKLLLTSWKWLLGKVKQLHFINGRWFIRMIIIMQGWKKKVPQWITTTFPVQTDNPSYYFLTPRYIEYWLFKNYFLWIIWIFCMSSMWKNILKCKGVFRFVCFVSAVEFDLSLWSYILKKKKSRFKGDRMFWRSEACCCCCVKNQSSAEPLFTENIELVYYCRQQGQSLVESLDQVKKQNFDRTEEI